MKNNITEGNRRDNQVTVAVKEAELTGSAPRGELMADSSTLGASACGASPVPTPKLGASSPMACVVGCGLSLGTVLGISLGTALGRSLGISLGKILGETVGNALGF